MVMGPFRRFAPLDQTHAAEVTSDPTGGCHGGAAHRAPRAGRPLQEMRGDGWTVGAGVLLAGVDVGGRVVDAVEAPSGAAFHHAGQLEDAGFLHRQSSAGDDAADDEGANCAGFVFQIGEGGSPAAVRGSFLAALFAGDAQLGAFEVGVIKFVEVGGVFFRHLVGSEGDGEGRREEVGVEVGVFDGAAVKGVAGYEEGFGVKGALFADGMCDCGGEFAGEGEVASHLAGKFFGGVLQEGGRGVPFELVDKSILTDCDGELDEDAERVVHVGCIWEGCIHRSGNW